jgi:hypothetical protein
MLELDIASATLLTGSVIPLLVAVATKSGASSRVKGLANLLLSFLGGAVTHLLGHDGGAPWQAVVNAGLLTWLVSGTAFHTLWGPGGTAGAVARRTSRVGVG